MNKDVMFSSKMEMWETPIDLFKELDEEFHFTVDVCATKENAKCKKFYTKEEDGLSKKWEGVVWCNPPYGRNVWRWVLAAATSALSGSATVVMLLPARTDTKWFHDLIYKKEYTEVRFLRGRLKFGGSKNSAPFPSMIVVFEKKGGIQ